MIDDRTPPVNHESPATIIGWDIGGVNTKCALVANGRVLAASTRPFELQRDPGALVPLLRMIAAALGGADCRAHGITMTAELSQMFRTKREGVAFVLDAAERAFPDAPVHVYAVDGSFVSPACARRAPLSVAASNWAATARLVATELPDAILLDIGTTTTDIIPIVKGAVAAVGRTDPERLATGELVYTGALRTPVEAIASHVPLRDRRTGVSAEGFALAGDVHVWRGVLAPEDYSVPTPDGRPATRELAGERLARVVCADREMLDEADISAIADALAEAQIAHIMTAIDLVRSRHPTLRTAVVTGLGAPLAAAAARRAGLDVASLAASLGDAAARCAPAAAVALLLEAAAPHQRRAAERGDGAPAAERPAIVVPNAAGRTVDAVVKIGGALLRHADHLRRVLDAVAAAARQVRLVVVPGGGPFADTVRDVDGRVGLGDDAAHWMAVLAMDQYAHLLAARLDDAAIVETPGEIAAALGRAATPVLAPSRWLRTADPLPHSWSVTSDSIAAWVAAALGAPRLVLVKAPAASPHALVDDHFSRALSAETSCTILTADRVDSLTTLLSPPAGAPALAGHPFSRHLEGTQL